MKLACSSCGGAINVAQPAPGGPPVVLPSTCPGCGKDGAVWLGPALTLHDPITTRSPERRPSWDESFMSHARIAAARSTCLRKQVGAVLVRDNLILSAGYAGAARGRPHCLEAGCLTGRPRLDGTTDGCKRTVHAEVNAVLNAARHGISTAGTVLYCTLSPCWACLLMLHNAGVVRVVYAERYRIFDEVEAEARAMGLRLHRLEDAITEEVLP